MTEGNSNWTHREAYVLALVPALGLACVHVYEMGRFSFLGIPFQLIDLPVTRLIAGGTAITIFVAMTIGFIQWSQRRLWGKSGFRRFLSVFATCFVLVGLPQLLQVTTRNGFVWAVLLPLALAMSYISSEETPKTATLIAEADSSEVDSKNRKSEARKQKPNEDKQTPPETPNAVAFLILAGLIAWSIFSMGFFSERLTSDRMCIEGSKVSFVAGFHADRAIVKTIESKTKKLEPSVVLLDLGPGLKVGACELSVRGMPSVFDQSFNTKPRTATTN